MNSAGCRTQQAALPASEDYAEAAVQTIYAGTNEIMKVIIVRRMGLSSEV
jgi:alkylation response protein AidB-like acyl-CoA dehydrogenase